MKILDTAARYVVDVCKIPDTAEGYIERYELNFPDTKKQQNEMLGMGIYGRLLFFLKEEHVDYFLTALRACDGATDAGNYFLIPIPLKIIAGHIKVELTRPKRNNQYYIQVSVIDIDEHNEMQRWLNR
jgi:hypothetical protein